MSHREMRKTKTRSRQLGSVSLLAVAGVMAPFWIEESVALEAMDPFADLTPVSDAELDTMRGGFSFRGVDINFGIDFKTVIDGIERHRMNWEVRGERFEFSERTFDESGEVESLTAPTVVNLTKVDNPAGGPPDVNEANTDTKTLIQNGTGNLLDLSGGPLNDIAALNFDGVATLIQNTVDGAVIQHLTTINVDVLNSATTIKASNLFQSLNLQGSGLGL